MNFVESHEVNDVITNHTPAAGEQLSYTATNSVDYCVVAYMPRFDHSGVVLLIEVFSCASRCPQLFTDDT